MYIYIYVCIYIYFGTFSLGVLSGCQRCIRSQQALNICAINSHIKHMGCLQLVDAFKVQVFFAEYRLFYGALLQKRSIIVKSLLTETTPYQRYTLSHQAIKHLNTSANILEPFVRCFLLPKKKGEDHRCILGAVFLSALYIKKKRVFAKKNNTRC